MPDTPRTRAELKKLNCVQLKKKLKKYDLKRTGRKNELITRLYDHLAEKDKKNSQNTTTNDIIEIESEDNTNENSISDFIVNNNEISDIDFNIEPSIEWISNAIKIEGESNSDNYREYFNSVKVNNKIYKIGDRCIIEGNDEENEENEENESPKWFAIMSIID